MPAVFDAAHTFEIGRASLLRPGGDVTIVVTGLLNFAPLLQGQVDATQTILSPALIFGIKQARATERALLADKAIDAVIIATPDHWHKQQTLDALAAGKHVYLEKPMTLTIDEGPEMYGAAEKAGRVLQIGSNGMSSKLQETARDIIKSGKLGEINLIRASYDRNSDSGAWLYPIPPDADPKSVNWDMFLGPAPKKAFSLERFFRWRCYWDYSGGIATDLFVHLMTTIHFVMGAKVPELVVATGANYRHQKTHEVPDTLNASVVYGKENFCVSLSGTFNSASAGESGFAIMGHEASLVFRGDRLIFTPEHQVEGNGWIVRRLLERLGRFVRAGAMAYSIRRDGRRYRVVTEAVEYTADFVIFAAPTFLAPHIVEGVPALKTFEYSPWLTANLTLDRWPAERGLEPAWDNVIHASPTLGYVIATHQSLRTRIERTVWTFYWALADGPALAYTFMYIAWTGTLVGEIGGVNQFKNSFKMFMGGNVFSMIVCAGFLWLLISRISNEFFTSSNFLWMSGNTGDMPVAPYYGIFLMALSKSPWIWLWIAIGLSAWFWIWPTNNFVMSTRVMFAMSYDRMLPGVVARVSRRWGAPIVAIGIVYVGAIIMGWLYFFTPFSKLTLDMPLMTSIAFAAPQSATTSPAASDDDPGIAIPLIGDSFRERLHAIKRQHRGLRM